MRRALARGGSAIRLALACVAGLIFLGIFVRSVSLEEVGALVGRANPIDLIAAALLFGLDMLVRSARFALMLGMACGARLSVRVVAPSYVASFGISDILPFRAGDAFRLFWFERRFRLGLGPLMSAMLLERILDLASVLMIGAVAIAFSTRATSPVARDIIEFVFILGACATIVLIVAPGLLKRALIRWFGKWSRSEMLIAGLTSAEKAVREMRRPTHLIPIALLSLLAWILEASVMQMVWHGLGGGFAMWLSPLLAFAFAALGTAVPSLPGHFGSFELAGFYGFSLTGVEPSLAAGTLFATHLILWAPTAIFAIGWLSLRARSRDSRKEIEERQGAAP